jgi:rare lipoprotein A
MLREARFYGLLVVGVCWLVMALLSASPVDAACNKIASWYGWEAGTHTANGDRWNPNGMTAAHASLPFGTVVRVTYGGRSVVVTITDRGPAARLGREIDLSMAAFAALAPLEVGLLPVCITVERP